MANCNKITGLGNAWIYIANIIINDGRFFETPFNNYYEVTGIFITIEKPFLPDPVIDKYGNPEWIDWMIANFTKHENVKELKKARSYAQRLYQYGDTKNQIEWIINKLNNNRFARSATITTFEPLTDTNYIPCVSILDFNITDDFLDIYVYCRSLDFGKKAYANLICLADIQEKVAKQTNSKIGQLHLIAKSVHIYDTDIEKLKNILSEVNDAN